jgi:hypothetical protein
MGNTVAKKRLNHVHMLYSWKFSFKGLALACLHVLSFVATAWLCPFALKDLHVFLSPGKGLGCVHHRMTSQGLIDA